MRRQVAGRPIGPSRAMRCRVPRHVLVNQLSHHVRVFPHGVSIFLSEDRFFLSMGVFPAPSQSRALNLPMEDDEKQA